MKRRTAIVLTIAGLILSLGSILTVWLIDRPLANSQPVAFTDPAGDKLVGTYYAGEWPYGVILLEGFGSDQITMRSLASEFARQGFKVFTFDFSGHGRSPGTLAFDNAATDRLAYQALAALDEFKQVSGLRAEQIFVIGHSLGARVALQAATMNPEEVAGLVLLGTQVNLSTNVQSEFFTGTTDADLSWVQGLEPENPPVPILLISGEWDDILTPENAHLLADKLGVNVDVPYFVNDRALLLVPDMFHNYEPFSSRVIISAREWIRNRMSQDIVFQDDAIAVSPERLEATIEVESIRIAMLKIPQNYRVWAWILGFIGLLIFLSGGEKWANVMASAEKIEPQVEVTHPRRFLWGKLLLWLAALPVAAILGSIFFFIPLCKPVFNLIYVGFIGGYGILLFFLYWRGRMPGVKGKLPFDVEKPALDWKRILAAIGVTLIVLILTTAYARTGWFYVFPLSLRLVWLVVFTPFTALGFWIGLHEARMLKAAGGTSWPQAALTLIGLFPFFLYTILMAAIGSLSGMLGGLQGLLILWLVLAFGGLVQAINQRLWLTAFCQAVLLYWLILPQGVLF